MPNRAEIKLQKNFNKLANKVYDDSVFGIDVVDKNGATVNQFRTEKGKNILTIPQNTFGGQPSVPDNGGQGGTGGSDSNNNENPPVADVGVDFDCPYSKMSSPKWLWGDGTNFNILDNNVMTVTISGDCLALVADVESTPVVGGVEGTMQVIPVKTDPHATDYIDGTYIAAAPTPIAIKIADLKDNKPHKIELGGLGEKVDEGTDIKTPAVEVTLNLDGTLTVSQYSGHKLTADCKNGFKYNVNVRYVDSFKFDDSEAGLIPEGTVLFNGTAADGILAIGNKLDPNLVNLKNGLILDGNNMFNVGVNTSSFDSPMFGTDSGIMPLYELEFDNSKKFKYVRIGSPSAYVAIEDQRLNYLQGFNNTKVSKLDLINGSSLSKNYGNKLVVACESNPDITSNILANGAIFTDDTHSRVNLTLYSYQASAGFLKLDSKGLNFKNIFFNSKKPTNPDDHGVHPSMIDFLYSTYKAVLTTITAY